MIYEIEFSGTHGIQSVSVRFKVSNISGNSGSSLQQRFTLHFWVSAPILPGLLPSLSSVVRDPVLYRWDVKRLEQCHCGVVVPCDIADGRKKEGTVLLAQVDLVSRKIQAKCKQVVLHCSSLKGMIIFSDYFLLLFWFGLGFGFFFGRGRRGEDEIRVTSKVLWREGLKLVLYLRCSVFVNKVTKFIPGPYLTLLMQQEKELLWRGWKSGKY